ncbi:MAG: helix-turn-helix domain-containing protein [Treponema sp.]|nr:helix-turn-helix domain-containing protein [Treponema sp.]
MTDKSKLFQDTKFISADEIANLLGLCEATIYNWIKQKKIPAYKIGNQYKMTLDDVFDFITSCKVA